MPVDDGVPRTYRNETQLSEQERPIVAAMSWTRCSSLGMLHDVLWDSIWKQTSVESRPIHIDLGFVSL